MREFLKRTKLNIVLISVLLIVVGVMLVVNPEFAAVTICRILGWILLIAVLCRSLPILSIKTLNSGNLTFLSA